MFKRVLFVLIAGIIASTALPRISFAEEVDEKKSEKTAAETEEGQGKEGTKKGEGRKEDEKPVELGKVIITAKSDVPRRVQSVILTDDVKLGRRSPSVEGLFKDLAGVQLSRKAAAGSDGNKVRLRGFDESRSLILLDGRNLHGAGVYGGYYVDWSSLSLEEIERVDVIRGAGPAKFGNTLGGIVNIVTKEGDEEVKTLANIAGGNMGTWNGEVSHTGRLGILRYNIAASRYETDGYLRNAFVKSGAGAARVAFKLPENMEFKIGTRYTEGKSGMIVYNNPSSPYYDTRKPKSLESQLGGPYVRFWDHGTGLWGPRDWGDGSYWENKRWQFDAGLSRNAENFGFSLRTYLFNEARKEYFYAMDAPQHIVLQRSSTPEDRNWGWRADFNNLLEGEGTHELEYGFEGHYLGYGDMDIRKVDATYFPGWAQPASSDGKRDISTLNGGYVQDLWRPNDWLEVEAGLRFDSFEADGPQVNAVGVDEEKWGPRAGLTVRPWEGGRVTGRYARAYRFPTLPEYYWWYSGFQPAYRRTLSAEKADQWELEIGHEVSDSLSVKARGYYYEVDDYLRTIFGYAPSRVVYNIGRVDFQGVELEASHKLPFGLAVWANYTIQKTEKHGDTLDDSANLTDELVELPENRFSLGLDLRHESGLEARLAARYMDGRHAVRGNPAVPGACTLKSMHGYVDIDFNFSCPLVKGDAGQECRFFVNVENLLDERYEEEYGYPMPGTSFMLGLKIRF